MEIGELGAELVEEQISRPLKRVLCRAELLLLAPLRQHDVDLADHAAVALVAHGKRLVRLAILRLQPIELAPTRSVPGAVVEASAVRNVVARRALLAVCDARPHRWKHLVHSSEKALLPALVCRGAAHLGCIACHRAVAVVRLEVSVLLASHVHATQAVGRPRRCSRHTVIDAAASRLCVEAVPAPVNHGGTDHCIRYTY